MRGLQPDEQPLQRSVHAALQRRVAVALRLVLLLQHHKVLLKLLLVLLGRIVTGLLRIGVHCQQVDEGDERRERARERRRRGRRLHGDEGGGGGFPRGLRAERPALVLVSNAVHRGQRQRADRTHAGSARRHRAPALVDGPVLVEVRGPYRDGAAVLLLPRGRPRPADTARRAAEAARRVHGLPLNRAVPGAATAAPFARARSCEADGPPQR
mmetsp:Transcript_57797/g.148668  ORF Transcript_57797/g.148668 Transcript_57797/m.148668 type:complete len:212 (-) Transcript_57797:1308-1943(-)